MFKPIFIYLAVSAMAGVTLSGMTGQKKHIFFILFSKVPTVGEIKLEFISRIFIE